jgi:hypothetical protein
MGVRRVSLFLVFFSAAICFAQVGADDNGRSLGDVAREQRARRPQEGGANPASRTLNSEGTGEGHASRAKISELVEELSSGNNEGDYASQMSGLLAKQDFEGLERAAERARTSQARFPGGIWKLSEFYETLSKSQVSRWSRTREVDHMNLLKHWNELYPGSTTAHIALAMGYLEVGGNARGSGYDDTVSDQGRAKFGRATNLAEAALQEAAALPEKDPYYYAAVLQVAVDSGWDKARTKTLFEEAIKFEPGFYHYYRLYANYLQAKWYGEPGEVERFAKESADRVGGEEGNFIYFEISSLLICGECDGEGNFDKLSWPRIKEGYAALDHLYGTSNLKMNRFAYMATAAHDQAAAKPVFMQIGGSWTKELWRSLPAFEAARKWVLADSAVAHEVATPTDQREQTEHPADSTGTAEAVPVVANQDTN